MSVPGAGQVLEWFCWDDQPKAQQQLCWLGQQKCQTLQTTQVIAPDTTDIDTPNRILGVPVYKQVQPHWAQVCEYSQWSRVYWVSYVHLYTHGKIVILNRPEMGFCYRREYEFTAITTSSSSPSSCSSIASYTGHTSTLWNIKSTGVKFAKTEHWRPKHPSTLNDGTEPNASS